MMRSLSILSVAGGLLATLAAQDPAAPVAAPVRHAVVATTPDLAALCRTIGGERCAVTTFLPGPQDPHYLDPRPAMLYAMQKAELLVETGRDLESGWLPVLINNSRNPAAQPGQIGHLDASRVVRALNVPTASIDRSAGDLHMNGNPHYLLDPLCGLQVAAPHLLEHRREDRQEAPGLAGDRLEHLETVHGLETKHEILCTVADLVKGATRAGDLLGYLVQDRDGTLVCLFPGGRDTHNDIAEDTARELGELTLAHREREHVGRAIFVAIDLVQLMDGRIVG